MGLECAAQRAATTTAREYSTRLLEEWFADSLSTLLGQQLIGGAKHVVRRDREQTRIRCVSARMIALAYSAAQHAGARAVRSVAARIGWPVNSNNRPAEGARQVQRARVSANAEGDAAHERDQLRQSWRDCNCSSGSDGCGNWNGPAGRDRRRDRPFTWSGVDHDMKSALGESRGDSGIALRRPALGAPTGSGSDQRNGLRSVGKCGCK